MIDLRKAALLESALALPFTFVMPNTLFEDEWLDLSAKEKRDLQAQGLEVHDLPGSTVLRAARYANQLRRLKLNDCFALTLAEDLEDSILLTGDGTLRRVAEDKGLEVRGVLWMVDELERYEIVPLQRLHDALALFRDDDLVFLPTDELTKRLRRLARIL